MQATFTLNNELIYPYPTNCSSPAELRRGGGDTFNSLPGELKYNISLAHPIIGVYLQQVWAVMSALCGNGDHEIAGGS